MRNDYNHHQQHQQIQIRSTFLPMLCSRPSIIKDVHFPSHVSDQTSTRRSDDPSSPKVGCMGQVKKKNHHNHHHHHHNNKLVMVFPTSTTSSSSSSSTTTAKTSTTVGLGQDKNNNFSYSKLLRLFSSKTLLSTPSLASSSTSNKTTTICCRRDRNRRVVGVSRSRLRSRSCESEAGFGSPIVSVADLDPPLPVVIKRRTTFDGGDQDVPEATNSLWKRRSGGAALKGLQIQQVKVPIQSATSV